MKVDSRMTSRTPRTMATTVAAYPTAPLVLFAAEIQYNTVVATVNDVFYNLYLWTIHGYLLPLL